MSINGSIVGSNNMVFASSGAFTETYALYKNSVCDIIYDFLGPTRHALLYESGACLEFAERFGAVWVQLHNLSFEWVPIDKAAFYEWATGPAGGLKSKHRLNREQVQKLLSDPQNG